MARNVPVPRNRKAHPRLYLVAQFDDQPTRWIPVFEQVLAAADIAAVLLRVPAPDQSAALSAIKQVVGVIQADGAAVLLQAETGLVAAAGADGAHILGIDRLSGAIRSLKPERIVGVGNLTSRHDCMVAGEAGADYLMFGEPDTAGSRPGMPAILDRVAWWSELFEVPCVGYAATIDEVGPLAAAGADFVALGPHLWQAGAPGSLEAIQRQLATEEAL
jgi:thiamine-phosphate pyrophosphorylase